MASTALVDEDIERGRKALQALDSEGVPAHAAFWRYAPESSDWRLVLAFPDAEIHGPRSLYERVARVLRKSKVELPVWRITVLSTDDPLAVWAKRRSRLAHRDVRSSSTVVDDTLIEDAYIYRSL